MHTQLDTCNLMDLFRAQEEEKPGAYTVQEYETWFSNATIWQQGVRAAQRKQFSQALRVGRWLYLDSTAAPLMEAHTIVVLDRNGGPLWAMCSRHQGGRPGLCVHIAQALYLWATSPDTFTPLKLYVRHPLHQQVSLPTPSLPEHEWHVYSQNTLIENFVTWASLESKLAELRALAERLGLSVKSRRKRDVAAALAAALLDKERVRPLFEALSPVERLVLFLSWVELRPPHSRWLEIALKYFMPDTHLTKQELEGIRGRLFGSLEHIWWAYGVFSASPLVLAPDWFDLAPWSVQAEPPEAHQPTLSASPWLPLQGLFRLAEVLSGPETFTFPEVSLPKAFPQFLFKEYPRLWHLDWVVIHNWAMNYGLLPFVPHSISLAPADLRALSQHLQMSEESTHLLVWTSLSCNLTSIRKGRLAIKTQKWTPFLKSTRGVQIRVVWRYLLGEIAHEALHRVQCRAPFRFVGVNERDFWQKGFTLRFDLYFLLRTLMSLVATAPPKHWIPITELRRLFQPWADEEMARLLFYGWGVDPPSDWPRVFEQWWQEALRMAAHMGLLEAVEENGQLTHVRHLHLRNLLTIVDHPLEEAELRSLSPEEVHVYATPKGLRVETPIDAPQALIDLLHKWGGDPRVTGNRLVFDFSLSRLVRRIQDRTSVEDMAQEWEKQVGFPLPSPLQEQLEQLFARRESVRVYPHLVLVRFQDKATRQQVEAVIPELQDPTIPLVDERTLAVPEDKAPEVLKKMDQAGYTPRRISMEAGTWND